MVKLYYPPAALLVQGTKDFVELGGAQCILAMDEEKQFIVISDVFSELSWGEFWKEVAISDQIEKITMQHDDSAAIYDPDIMIQRVISALEKIMNQRLLYFGVSSFEGNAFERVVFDEIELSTHDIDTLINIYKFRRLANAFPNVKQGSFVDINFFGEINSYFLLPDKKIWRDIALTLDSYEGQISGIVCSAQGAANFIILTETVSPNAVKKGYTVDMENLRQMFHLIDQNIITPISWFKIDLGLKGLEHLQNWDEIKDDTRIQDILKKYGDYVKKIISQKEIITLEKLIQADLGSTIEINKMKEKEKFMDLEEMMDAINKLNELDMEGSAFSQLYYPPNVLLSYADQTGAAIGGAMALLSMDVGKSIYCIAELRDYLSWGQYYADIDPQATALFDDFKERDFFNVENPFQLAEIYIKALQNIMKDSQIFFGEVELENNAFELSLFQELDLDDADLKKMQTVYYEKSKANLFPKLVEGHIQLTWNGLGKEYFINDDCLGILDLAKKIVSDPIYKNGICAGVVCVDNQSAHFYILSSNFFTSRVSSIDTSTLNVLFEDIKQNNIVPLCFFKISLGLEIIKHHEFWKTTSQYTNMLYALDNYIRYINELLAVKSREDQFRIYD